MTLARIYFINGRYSDAGAIAEKAGEEMKVIRSSRPLPEDFAPNWSNLRELQWDIAKVQEDWAKTAEIAPELVTMSRDALAKNPADADLIWGLGIALSRQTDTAQHLGRLDDALGYCREALATLTRLVDRDPSRFQWAREHGFTRKLLAKLLLANGQFDEAWAEGWWAVTILEQLPMFNQRQYQSWAADLADAYTVVGEVGEKRRQAGDRQLASLCVERANEVLGAGTKVQFDKSRWVE
jgi:tetratricopeptide (TPR) repeat protein